MVVLNQDPEYAVYQLKLNGRMMDITFDFNKKMAMKYPMPEELLQSYL